MNESSYTDMMNNIASYLDKYCGLTHDNKQVEGETVEDVLTELIHMNTPKDEQNGGVLIDDVMTNLTGGMVGGKNKTQSKPDIVEIAFKDVDMNLLEGGDKNKVPPIDEQNENSERVPKNDQEQQTNTEAIEEVAKEQTTETQTEQQTERQAPEVDKEPTKEQTEQQIEKQEAERKQKGSSSTSEDEDSDYSYSDSSESDYSDDDDGTEPVDEFKNSAYEAFLKRYSEHELTNSMRGGDNKERLANSKIHILPMFPYLLRY